MYKIQSSFFSTCTSSLPILGLFHNGRDHFIAQAIGFCEPRRKVFLNLLKAISISRHVPKGNAIRPAPGSKSELEIVRTESIVVNRSGDDLVQQSWISE